MLDPRIQQEVRRVSVAQARMRAAQTFSLGMACTHTTHTLFLGMPVYTAPSVPCRTEQGKAFHRTCKGKKGGQARSRTTQPHDGRHRQCKRPVRGLSSCTCKRLGVMHEQGDCLGQGQRFCHSARTLRPRSKLLLAFSMRVAPTKPLVPCRAMVTLASVPAPLHMGMKGRKHARTLRSFTVHQVHQ